MDEKAVATFLRRRRSASLPPPPKVAIHHHHSHNSSSTSSSSDVELLSVMEPTSSPVYTSLKDLIPLVNAYSPRSTCSPHEARPVSIRNRLVKRAAWAYLMPMSTSPGSEGGGFLLWQRVKMLLDRIRRGVVWVVEWVIRVRSSM